MPSSEPFEMMIDTLVIASLILPPSSVESDAATGLGDARDLRRELGRSLREQLVQLLDGHSRRLAEQAHRRSRTLLLELLAHEVDDLPMAIAQRRDALTTRDLDGQLLVPLARVDEEALVID